MVGARLTAVRPPTGGRGSRPARCRRSTQAGSTICSAARCPTSPRRRARTARCARAAPPRPGLSSSRPRRSAAPTL